MRVKVDAATRKPVEKSAADRSKFQPVTEDTMASVLATWTGIPVQKLTSDESVKLLQLEQQLHERVVGQAEAARAIGRAVRRARVGLSSPTRPVASFVFSGPTGVGKTELAKALAEVYYGDERASMVRLDMSEYMERHAVSKLTGPPPGYIGYEQGGQLTEAVRRQPHTVILLDEIEKAHPDVYNVMLQILDDGRLTDSKGRTVDFTNSILIMTSNVGSSAILEEVASAAAEEDGSDEEEYFIEEDEENERDYDEEETIVAEDDNEDEEESKSFEQVAAATPTTPNELISSVEAMERLISDAEAGRTAPIPTELQTMITQMRAITSTTKDALREVETNSGEENKEFAEAAGESAKAKEGEDAKKKQMMKKRSRRKSLVKRRRRTADDASGAFTSTAAAESYGRMQALVKKELLASFRPEFLNRLDEIIVFRSLTKPELTEVRMPSFMHSFSFVLYALLAFWKYLPGRLTD